MNIQPPVQYIELTKNISGESVWVNPGRIAYMDVGVSKEPVEKDPKDSKKKAEPAQMTILHIAGAKKELFVRETPNEINRKIRAKTTHFEIAYKGK